MKKIIYLLVLTIALAGGAVAQKTSKTASRETIPVDSPTGPVLKQTFTGKESSPAKWDEMNNMFRGNSSVFISNDRTIATSLTLSVDYVPVEDQPGIYQATGGSWTLMVYENGSYVGAIYGEVVDGTLTDSIAEGIGPVEYRTSKLRFRILGGMERYENLTPEEKPSGDFSCSMDYAEGHAEAILLNIL